MIILNMLIIMVPLELYIWQEWFMDWLSDGMAGQNLFRKCSAIVGSDDSAANR